LWIIVRGENVPARAGRASYSGPLRIEPTQITAQRDLRNPANQVLNVGLEIAWEPRLRPIRIRQKESEVTAVDPSQRPLALSDPQAVLEPTVRPGTAAVQMVLPLRLPPRSAQRIARLDGNLRVLLPGRVETFRFDRLSQAVTLQKRIAGTTVTLQRVAHEHDCWSVEVVVRFDQAGEALESHRGWIFSNQAVLEGPDGKPIAPRSFEATRQTENELGIRYLFDGRETLDGCQFLYRTPVLILDKTYEYQLRDIDLP
jgi:hypothetical protein